MRRQGVLRPMPRGRFQGARRAHVLDQPRALACTLLLAGPSMGTANAARTSRNAQVQGGDERGDGSLAMPDEASASAMAELLRVLGHPLRLRIVVLLSNEPALSVKALAEQLGVQQSLVSHQLRFLRLAEVVASARQQGESRYSLVRPCVRGLLRCLLTERWRAPLAPKGRAP